MTTHGERRPQRHPLARVAALLSPMQPQACLKQQSEGAARHLGASTRLAEAIGMTVDLAAGGLFGGGEKAAVKATEEGGRLLEEGVRVEKGLHDAVKLEKGAPRCRTGLRAAGIRGRPPSGPDRPPGANARLVSARRRARAES